jgi:hypothetical protein
MTDLAVEFLIEVIKLMIILDQLKVKDLWLQVQETIEHINLIEDLYIIPMIFKRYMLSKAFYILF